MVRHPGEYRWSSYRGRACGIPDALLDADPWYTGLGTHATARQQAYQAWVDSSMPANEWAHIRQATQRGRMIGAEQFQREIEAMLGRRLVGREIRVGVEYPLVPSSGSRILVSIAPGSGLPCYRHTSHTQRP
jgi:hypothetical protein